MRILIVKHGALGDVVRTSYFAGALRRKFGKRLELYWVTAPTSQALLSQNPYIDNLITSFADLDSVKFDVVYSLDDELPIVSEVSRLNAKRIAGAFLADGKLTYSPEAAEWFDMGLLSKFGKVRADELKRSNVRGHAEIFQRIFDVDDVLPEFFLDADCKATAENFFSGFGPLVGINPYAGGRWPSKEIRDEELHALVRAFCERSVVSRHLTIVLFGAREDRLRNLAFLESFESRSMKQSILVADTDASLMTLSSYISCMNLMISSDSLAMHLAIAQSVPTLAFFAPTSASEIDSFGICEKLISTAPDYCSYAKDCDNSSITAARLLEKIATSNLGKLLLDK